MMAKGPGRLAVKWMGRSMAGASRRPALQRYSLALILPAGALAITSGIANTSNAPYFPLFTLAVLLVSIFGGTAPGLLAMITSVLINAVTAAPRGSLRVANADDLIRICVFAIVASAIAILLGSIGELQRRLDNERSKLSITLHSIADAVMATDTDGRITLMNPAAEALTGVKIADAAGLPLESVFNIVHEHNRAPVESPVARVLAEGEPATLANDTVLLRPDGTDVAIEDSAAPIRDEHGTMTGAVLVFRDVTEMKRHHRALIRSEKLETAIKLGATIAHETNNPLEALANLLFLISRDDAVSEETRASVELAEAQLLRAVEASRRTLSFVSFERKITHMNLRAVVDSILHSYAPAAKNFGVILQNEIPPGIEVAVQRDGMQQLISNLVSNALDAMAATGGNLCVSAEVTRNNPSDHLSDNSSGQVILRFIDTGHGIDPANLNRIFEPFFTTRKDKGTGLGLWLANRVVEEHGGTLHVDSGSEGTTFTVVLPQQSVATGAEASVAPGAPLPV